jgi:hypothetical protein
MGEVGGSGNGEAVGVRLNVRATEDEGGIEAACCCFRKLSVGSGLGVTRALRGALVDAGP